MKKEKRHNVKNYIIREDCNCEKKYIGIIDKNDNIYYLNDQYFGTIERKKKPLWLIFLIAFLIFSIICIAYIICLIPHNDDVIKVYQNEPYKQWNTQTRIKYI